MSKKTIQVLGYGPLSLPHVHKHELSWEDIWIRYRGKRRIKYACYTIISRACLDQELKFAIFGGEEYCKLSVVRHELDSIGVDGIFIDKNSFDNVYVNKKLLTRKDIEDVILFCIKRPRMTTSFRWRRANRIVIPV